MIRQLAFEEVPIQYRDENLCYIINSTEFSIFLHAALAYFKLYLECEEKRAKLASLEEGFGPQGHDHDREMARVKIGVENVRLIYVFSSSNSVTRHGISCQQRIRRSL